MKFPKEEMPLNRLYVAITTPFTNDDSIDFVALASHLKFLESNGIDALFLGGTTGEFETLTFEERHELLRFTRANFQGVIVANVSSCSLKESLAFVKDAEEFGADMITALPPFYRANVGESGIASFFNTIADASKLPLILYNFSLHSQNTISLELMNQIRCAAVKDSDKNYGLIQPFPVYLCGGDSIIAEAISRGAGGVVSVQGNYQPSKIVELFSAAKLGDPKAFELQDLVAQTAAIFRKSKQIARIKQALSSIISGYPTAVRIPLMPLFSDEQNEISLWCKENGYE